MTRRVWLILLVSVQALCAAVFVWEIVASILGLRSTPISWQAYEFIEIGAATGLLLGVILGAIAIRAATLRSERAETALRAASGAFMEVLEERFNDWGLTPAERDVALFAIKGLSIQEIADVRDTSEGTVKAQTNAIYRKAGVSGRPQLLSLFIDELMEI